MTAPIPEVRRVPRVTPRCYQCGSEDGIWAGVNSKATRLLIQRDGPVICRSCIQIGVRLAVVGGTR